ncbi:UNVERIFIED_CONTAM: hypothetical protein Q9R58_25810 [Methylobacteriaceae bacterium AG10]|nr:hypothetical protein [Methylobacteriaceae bacterium AG10]
MILHETTPNRPGLRHIAFTLAVILHAPRMGRRRSVSALVMIDFENLPSWARRRLNRHVARGGTGLVVRWIAVPAGRGGSSEDADRVPSASGGAADGGSERSRPPNGLGASPSGGRGRPADESVGAAEDRAGAPLRQGWPVRFSTERGGTPAHG